MFRPLLLKPPAAWRSSTKLFRSIRLDICLRLASSFPTIKACPLPTCSCAETPEMPSNLPIDYSKPLDGTMPSYAEQVLICTGKADWASKIEEENSGDNLAADIGELMGRGGKYADPFHHVSILNSSFPSSIPQRNPEIQTSSAYLLPSFKYIPFLPRISFDSVHALVKGYLLPTKLHSRHDGLSPIHRDSLLRNPEEGKFLPAVRDVNDVMVLICGHGGRDARCGILGPLLKAEFEDKLPRIGYTVIRGAVNISETQQQHLLGADEGIGLGTGTARVGLISHIGGHKFAGNVIIYLPSGSRIGEGKMNPLAGCGIWYGRVEPRHVEGIVNETVLGGRVIEEHFRGGIRQNGEIMRL